MISETELTLLHCYRFGFVLEALAFFAMYKGKIRSGCKVRQIEAVASAVVFVAGIFILVGGAYSSISASKSLCIAIIPSVSNEDALNNS